ncbi:MAG: hypothetical protein D3907_10000 [Candidatus Electrothrix sp. AUS3]|nr:hypothetical protein [Candidatus Electrothrix gigas]
MNQPQMNPRYTLKVIVETEKGMNDTEFDFSVPTSQPMPLPGDEIEIPTQVAEEKQLGKNHFRVKRRRFILDALPIGITGMIYLVVE